MVQVSNCLESIKGKTFMCIFIVFLQHKAFLTEEAVDYGIFMNISNFVSIRYSRKKYEVYCY